MHCDRAPQQLRALGPEHRCDRADWEAALRQLDRRGQHLQRRRGGGGSGADWKPMGVGGRGGGCRERRLGLGRTSASDMPEPHSATVSAQPAAAPGTVTVWMCPAALSGNPATPSLQRGRRYLWRMCA